MTEILLWVKDYGFPAVIALYLIVTVTRTVAKNTEAVVLHTEAIKSLSKVIEYCRDKNHFINSGQ